MKKIYFYLLVLALVALACEYDGFIRGFNQAYERSTSMLTATKMKVMTSVTDWTIA